MYEDSLLDDVIEKRIKEIDKLEPGSTERSRAISDLKTLLDARLNRKKDEDAVAEREGDAFEAFKKEEESRKREAELDARKQKSEKIDRWLKVGLEVLGIGAPLVVYSVFMAKGFKFEESGTYTSGTFRNLINKLGPRKK